MEKLLSEFQCTCHTNICGRHQFEDMNRPGFHGQNYLWGDGVSVQKVAIKERAAAVIVAHNHPSGNIEPSAEDRAVTRTLVEAGEL